MVRVLRTIQFTLVVFILASMFSSGTVLACGMYSLGENTTIPDIEAGLKQNDVNLESAFDTLVKDNKKPASDGYCTRFQMAAVELLTNGTIRTTEEWLSDYHALEALGGRKHNTEYLPNILDLTGSDADLFDGLTIELDLLPSSKKLITNHYGPKINSLIEGRLRDLKSNVRILRNQDLMDDHISNELRDSYGIEDFNRKRTYYKSDLVVDPINNRIYEAVVDISKKNLFPSNSSEWKVSRDYVVTKEMVNKNWGGDKLSNLTVFRMLRELHDGSSVCLSSSDHSVLFTKLKGKIYLIDNWFEEPANHQFIKEMKSLSDYEVFFKDFDEDMDVFRTQGYFIIPK